MTIPLLTATMSITRFMIKTILVALVGMGMGAMVGLLAALLGAGNLAILMGAVLGGLVFSLAAPRIGRAA
jgi:ABC-type phosphate/phosphonate transport system permease subunit